MIGFINKHYSKVLALCFAVLFVNSALASQFKVGDTVFVAYPAANIKDDAFIIGKVKQVLPNGDYKISVIDYVEGHDYGVSCVPMVKNESATSSKDELSQVWDMWTDTTKLNKEELDYVVSKKDVVDLGYGKTSFIERNNLYIVFGRWKSDAPMLNVERIAKAEQQAKAVGLADMNPAFELAKLHRASFYGDFGRPLMPFESIKPLVSALKAIEALFTEDKELKNIWFAKQRDWKKLSKNTKYYFMVEAIDKVVEDSKSQLYEEDIDKADPKDLNQLKQLVTEFSRK
ncbi:MAG TPA: hypothetical protein ENK73_08430 [Thiomicrospira sp.]|nr:hypothetical protein [Thiomicrospira sp.]